jgi:hypothetical protein
MLKITGLAMSSITNNNSEIEVVIETNERTLGLVVDVSGSVTLYDRTVGNHIVTRCNIEDVVVALTGDNR